MDDDQRPDKAPASAPLGPRAMMQGGSTSNAPSPPRDWDRRPIESARDRDDVPLSNQPSASGSRPAQQYPPTGPSGRLSSQRDRGEPSRSDNADRDRDRDRRDGGGNSSRSGGGGGGQTSSTQVGDSGSLAERIGGVPPSLPARPDTARHHSGRESRSEREIPRKRTFQG